MNKKLKMKKIVIALLAFVQILFANAQEEIQVTPFSAQAGLVENDWEEYFSIEMNNELAYTALQFDLILPEGMTLIDDGPMECVPERFSGITKRGQFIPNAASTCVKVKDNNGNEMDNHYRITLYHDDLDVIKGNDGELLRFYYLTSEDMKDGLYPIILKDVCLAVTSSISTDVQVSSSFVTIGSQMVNESDLLYLDGEVPSFVMSELPAQNVVVNGTCNNLVITDGAPMNFSAPFTAVNVSYDRNVTNDWGTICLPYAISSDDDIQLYQLKEKSGETLIFSEVASLEAGKPGVFKRLDTASSVTMSANNAPIVVSVGEGNIAESLKMIGTFEDITVTVDPSAPSYYIKDNTFLKGNGNFKIPAYRAYFQSEGPSSVKVFNIAVEDEETGVTTVVGKLDAESGEIFSINGMKISEPAHNSLYIKNGKKFIAK